jgi:hypothetical protein
VATQLIRKSPLAMVQARMPLILSTRVLLGGFALIVALGLASLFAGIHEAHRDEAAARKRFDDAQALIALPPASTDAIQEDLVAVRDSIATAEAAAAPVAIDPPADAATSVLVRGAQASGLTVKAVSLVAAAQAKLGDNTYDTHGIRMTVDGRVGQMTAFLNGLSTSQPSLIPSLATMTINDAGLAHAEIVFSTYAKVASPTPEPRATATPKGKK